MEPNQTVRLIPWEECVNSAKEHSFSIEEWYNEQEQLALQTTDSFTFIKQYPEQDSDNILEQQLVELSFTNEYRLTETIFVPLQWIQLN